LEETLNSFATHFSLTDLVSVGHRVVHGGDAFSRPVAITDATLAAIVEVTPLAALQLTEALSAFAHDQCKM
jgi:acetate kinase